MKNLWALGTLCVTAFLAALLIFPATAQNAPSPRSQQQLVARGKYLMEGPVGCDDCHTAVDEHFAKLPNMDFAGGFRFDSPVFTAYAANITPDKDTGIGTWTDAEIVRAIREGHTKEGEIIGPPMPLMTYNNMSDDDVNAIVAYLHTVKPIHHEVPASQYKIPLHAMPPAKGLPAPPPTDKVAYGSYIVNGLAHCFECHTSPGPNGIQDFAHHLGAGGFPLIAIQGKMIRSLNITPDRETGIGSWTDQQIARAITNGIDKDGKQLIPLMPYEHYKNMTAADVDAVLAYLHTIPAVRNAVDPNPTLGPPPGH